MKAKLDFPYLVLAPEDSFEAGKIAQIPWVLTSPAGPFVYWTRIIDLARISKLKIEPGDLALLSAHAKVKPDLSHLHAQDFADVVNPYFTKKFQPRPYQITGIAHLMDKSHVILADETGTGKTLIAMGAVMIREFKEPSDKTIVIVCPSGIRNQWRSELMKMFRNPHTANEQALNEDLIQIYDGPPLIRQAIMKLPPRKVFIVGYDLLIRDAKAIAKHLAGGISALVLDESSRIKNVESKTAQTIATLVRHFKPRQLFCLNATPVENHLAELWPQMYVVQPTIFPSWKDFDSTYIRRIELKVRSGIKVSKVVGHKNVEHLHALIKDRYIRRRYQDVEGDLPEIMVSHRFVDLGSTQQRLYDLVKNDPKKNALERVSALVRAALFTKDDNGKMHSAKLDELPELVDELGDERCVFVSQSKVFALEVRKVLEDYGKVGVITGDVPDEERTRIVRDFTAGQIRYLVGTEAIERGLNLQAAGWLVNLDLPWTAASWFQRVGRVRRIGSKHSTVKIINMIANDTAEDYVFNTVYMKHNLFTRLFGATDVEPVSVSEIARAV